MRTRVRMEEPANSLARSSEWALLNHDNVIIIDLS
jgi:hypothetical protein